MNYPDGFVSKDKMWLHFAFDDNRHRAVHYSAKLPPVAKPDPDASKTMRGRQAPNGTDPSKPGIR